MSRRNKKQDRTPAVKKSDPLSLKKGRFPLITAVLISIFATALYLNTLRNGFVWDDEATIENNTFIISLDNLPKLFTPEYYSDRNEVLDQRKNFLGSGEVTYRPLVTLSYMTDYLIWVKNPVGYHLTNAVIHGACSFFLILFVWVLFQNGVWALLSGTVFAVHPVVTEAVNAVSFREDIMSLLFLLPAMILFTKSWHREPHRLKLTILPAVFTFLACLSKEMGASTPLLMGAVCLTAPRRNLFKPENFKMLILPGLATAFYLLIYFVLMKNPSEEPIGWYANRLDIHVAAMIRTFGLYILLFLGLARNCIDHNIVPPPTLYDAKAFLSLAGLTAVAVAGFLFYRKKERAGFGLTWIVISLLPVAGIIPTAHLAAERYLYVPLAGFAILAGWFILQISGFLARKSPLSERAVIWLLVSIITLYGSIRVVIQNRAWEDRKSLWQATIEVNPKSHMAQYGLANCYFKNKEYEKAIPHYEKAIKIDPTNTRPYNNLGLCYTQLGEYEKAISVFERGIDTGNENYRIYNNLTQVLILSKNYSYARMCIKKALKLNPNYPSALYNLASIDLFQGKYEDAMLHVKQSLELSPNYKPSLGLYDYLLKNPPKQ